MKQVRSLAVALALLGASAPLPAQPAGLAAETDAAARQLQERLPIRADDVTTVVGVRADGAEFVYDMRLSEVVPLDRLEARQQLVQGRNEVRMCEGEAGAFIRRGGAMRHVYTDPEGHTFETRVARCPDAAK